MMILGVLRLINKLKKDNARAWKAVSDWQTRYCNQVTKAQYHEARADKFLKKIIWYRKHRNPNN